MTLFGLSALLAGEPDLAVVGTAERADRARSVARRQHPDLVVLPMRLQGDRAAGVELCRHLRDRSRASTLIYTAFTEPEDLAAAMIAGADGLVGKWARPPDLLAAIREVLAGHHVWLPVRRPGREEVDRSAIDDSGLTGREREILRLLLAGNTNRQIARALTIEITTVKTHVRAILRKLGIASRRELF